LTYWLLLTAVAIYTLWWGGRDERLVMLICIAASLSSLLVIGAWRNSFSTVEIGILVVDHLALFGFIAVAIYSPRFWPLWVAGFQLVASLSHLMKAVHFELIPQAYAAAERLWVYPIFAVLLVGTWRAQRRRTIAATAD
jgi:hypothetical protein